MPGQNPNAGPNWNRLCWSWAPLPVPFSVFWRWQMSERSLLLSFSILPFWWIDAMFRPFYEPNPCVRVFVWPSVCLWLTNSLKPWWTLGYQKGGRPKRGG